MEDGEVVTKLLRTRTAATTTTGSVHFVVVAGSVHYIFHLAKYFISKIMSLPLLLPRK